MRFAQNRRLEDDMFLALARGIRAEAALELRAALAGRSASRMAPEALHRLALSVGAAGAKWPARRAAAEQSRLLGILGSEIAWRGEESYPPRLEEGLDRKAPPWVVLWGDHARLQAPACAIIGSRQTPDDLCRATRRLARELSDRGVAIVSGMAPGADSAAHRGAAEGEAGTIAVPARGLLQIESEIYRGGQGKLTMVGLGRPDEPFSAGLAIRRNDAISALAGGVVLVATGLQGGSTYAVNWALKHGRPVWCFDCGARTPAGNKHLLRSGLARPLRLSAAPSHWADGILQNLNAPQSARPRAMQLNLIA